MITPPRVEVLADTAALVTAAAELVVAVARGSIDARGRFTLALSGGSTPRPVYARLAEAGWRERIDWSRVHVGFGDERCVPPDDPQSNYHMARAVLFDHVPIPPDNIHRIRGEDPPDAAADAYADTLAALFDTETSISFDLVLLGMGDNGHTASLFPGLAAVTDHSRWVMAQYVEVARMWRVTLTPVIINAARSVVFLVAGADKATMLQRVLEGPYDPVVLPAQSIQSSDGPVRWLVDRAAAARLRGA